MARDNNTPATNASKKDPKYIGPDYGSEVYIHGVPVPLDPKSWDNEERATMIAAYPKISELFK